MICALRPELTLAEVFGPRRVFVPRAHPQTSAWIPRDDCFLDAHTGCQLCVAGSMPVVCSAGALAPAAVDLLAEAGLETPDHAQPYRDPAHGLELARARAAAGETIVLQHAHPAGAIPEQSQWISTELLAYLNNKANLAALVPAAHVPARSVRSRASVFETGALQTPVVLKVPTDLTTGAGEAVFICRTKQDLAEAATRLGSCTDVVVEEFLPIARNVCLHYVVLPDGGVRYLGFADQEVSDAGRYLGNWIHLGARLPADVVDVGRRVASRGATLGYRGIVGMDVVLLGDGRCVVIDLNFRVNGSTPAVLLAPAILDASGQGVLHLRKFTSPHDVDRMIAAARPAARRGTLIPLTVFDPLLAGHPGEPARMVGLVRGESAKDVAQAERDLASQGLT